MDFHAVAGDQVVAWWYAFVFGQAVRGPSGKEFIAGTECFPRPHRDMGIVLFCIVKVKATRKYSCFGVETMKGS